MAALFIEYNYAFRPDALAYASAVGLNLSWSANTRTVFNAVSAQSHPWQREDTKWFARTVVAVGALDTTELWALWSAAPNEGARHLVVAVLWAI